MLTVRSEFAVQQVFLDLARRIDPQRTDELVVELPEGLALGTLLGVAYPALTPVSDWQIEALGSLEEEGVRAERTREEVLTRLRGAGEANDWETMARALRRAVWRERARIALRELLPATLGGADFAVTAREISWLAETSFEIALSEAAAHTAALHGEPRRADGSRSNFVVMGMGKLGGEELNAGSDIDVVFIYDTDESEDGRSLHEHWTRVAARAVRTIEERTADGAIWRVDLRLRPEGSRGPLVNSLGAAERYYETWGRLWERAALLRARPIAGDLEFGDSVLREVFTPFVYRREVDPEIATALAELVQRSRAELSKAPERDLKLGFGGIREAEFFIQSLQLIWGGQERTLRVPGSLAALERLESRGLVSDGEARRLRQAYLFLRTLEHYVQHSTGVQTHLLPEQGATLERMARALSFAGADALLDVVARARSDVSELFMSLLPSVPRPPSPYLELLGRLDDPDVDLPDYARRHFGNPDVAEHLAALARRPDGLLGSATRERYPDIADEVLDAVRESADAEQASRYLKMFFARFLTPAPYVSAFGEDRRGLKRLISVLGASVFTAEGFVHSPDLVDSVLFGGGGSTDPEALIDTLLAEARRTVNPHGDAYEWRHTVQTVLRRAKQRVMVEVAVMDLAGEIGTREVTRRLASLADEELERALRFELPDATGLSVIAVGKLGGQDIGYASDLDVLFIFDPGAAPLGCDPAEYYVRLAQRVIRLISEPHPAGPGYELDTRLRPSGKSGLLVASLASFARYHGVALEGVPRDTGPAVLSSGEAWERQALLRARVCAGDRALGQRAIEVAETAAYERGAPAVSEMHHLRMRMERELARERPGYFDLKTGRGGLLDVEFAVQWLQMRHGADRHVRTPDTATALSALQKGGYLSLEHFQALGAGYKFLRRLEQRIVVLNGSGNTVVTRELPGLAQLARRMGLEDTPQKSGADELVDRYVDVTARVRAAYFAVLGLSEA